MKLNRSNLKNILIFLAIVALLSFGTDWLRPYLDRSPFWHGLMVVAGGLALPLFTLIMRIENDPRPFPPNARYPRILLGALFYGMAYGMIFWGLGFWFPTLRAIGIWIGGLAVASGVLFIILLLLADRAKKGT